MLERMISLGLKTTMEELIKKISKIHLINLLFLEISIQNQIYFFKTKV